LFSNLHFPSASSFFLGSHKVLRVALGREEEDEHRPGLHSLALRLRGDSGLICTNLGVSDLEAHLGTAAVAHYARAGQRADDTVVLEAGPLFTHGGSVTFPHTMEPALRACGVPCRLRNGVVEVLGEHTVCTAGQVLSAHAAQALRLLDVKLATFHMVLDSVWRSSDASFEVLSEPDMELDLDAEHAAFADDGDFTVTEVDVPDDVYRQRRQAAASRAAAVDEEEEGDDDEPMEDEERDAKRGAKAGRAKQLAGGAAAKPTQRRAAAAATEAPARPKRTTRGGAQ
jgi:mRNA turnover protein 4